MVSMQFIVVEWSFLSLASATPHFLRQSAPTLQLRSVIIRIISFRAESLIKLHCLRDVFMHVSINLRYTHAD
jgi:hypothetical protein